MGCKEPAVNGKRVGLTNVDKVLRLWSHMGCKKPAVNGKSVGLTRFDKVLRLRHCEKRFANDKTVHLGLSCRRGIERGNWL